MVNSENNILQWFSGSSTFLRKDVLSLEVLRFYLYLGATRVPRRLGGERTGAPADVPRVRCGSWLCRLWARAGAAVSAVPRLQAVPVPDRHAWHR